MFYGIINLMFVYRQSKFVYYVYRAVARTLVGMCILIYSGSARLTSFEINFISKETSRAGPEYINVHPPPINALATAQYVYNCRRTHCAMKTLL